MILVFSINIFAKGIKVFYVDTLENINQVGATLEDQILDILYKHLPEGNSAYDVRFTVDKWLDGKLQEHILYCVDHLGKIYKVS